jgi:hypothetical protein
MGNTRPWDMHARERREMHAREIHARDKYMPAVISAEIIRMYLWYL